MRSLCLLVLSLLVASGAEAQSHVELILDASGSMYNKLEDGRYRLVAAKDALRAFIDGLPDENLNVGLRIYGSGIVSSHGESLYCLDDPKPHRILFNLMRVMRTEYRIDAFQECYFVIDSFDQLFDATRPDFTHYYEILSRLPNVKPGEVLAEDRLLDGQG